MSVIGNLSVKEFQSMINRFDKKYIEHWNSWLSIIDDKAQQINEFGRILRSWQAFRPNVMRRPQAQAIHEPPYLEIIVDDAKTYIQEFQNFDLGEGRRFTADERKILVILWNKFTQLSFEGKRKTKRNGIAGVVGISKAVLLLTKGAIGPAFDSKVRKKLHIREPENASQWIDAIELAAQDAHQFQVKNNCTLQEAAPEQFRHLMPGRIYDMALGPGV
jgi:hypothetical protein